MTSELRPAVEVWDDAIAAWAADTIDTRQAAAAVIEADREAVRAPLLVEIERLRERLEIDPAHPYDGIYARDETIRGLDAELLKLKARDIGWSMQFEEQAAELAKFKALAETLAGALEAGTRFMSPSATVWHREAAKALREYKEARDAS